MSFSPSVPTILNTSNCFVFGNTASGNALSVQQLGAGNVFVTSNASGRVALFVSATSNVGVGTTSPQYPLDIGGFASSAQTLRIGATSSNACVRIMEANDTYGFSMENIATAVAGASGARMDIVRHSASAQGTPIMSFIRDNPYVGIGTASPQTTLETCGTGFIPSTLTRTSADANFGVATQYSLISTTGSFRGNYARVYGGSIGAPATSAQSQANGYLALEAANAGVFASDGAGYSGAQFYVANTKCVFNTNVGIGAASPNSFLQVQWPYGGSAPGIIVGDTTAYSGQVGLALLQSTVPIGNGVSIQLGRTSGVNSAFWGYTYGGGTFSDYSAILGYGYTPGTGFNVRNDGRVGIGSNTFTSTLTVTGTCTVTGAMTKGSGTFDIAHPVLPEPKRLCHSFIEGPRCDLIYRGSVRLVNGQATVNIDSDCTSNAAHAMTQGTFEALCANPVCFLQNDDTFDRVKGKVQGSELAIVCENADSTATINWMVVAERKDPFIKQWDRTDPNGFLIPEYDALPPEH